MSFLDITVHYFLLFLEFHCIMDINLHYEKKPISSMINDYMGSWSNEVMNIFNFFFYKFHDVFGGLNKLVLVLNRCTCLGLTIS